MKIKKKKIFFFLGGGASGWGVGWGGCEGEVGVARFGVGG